VKLSLYLIKNHAITTYWGTEVELLTPWSRVLLEKLMVTQLVNPFFKEPEGSLLFSQEPTTGPYSESDESILHLPTILPYDPF
jgi:hypothetical protein